MTREDRDAVTREVTDGPEGVTDGPGGVTDGGVTDGREAVREVEMEM